MKLLICTQAVDRDDSTLGFFHRWIEVCARHCEQVLVICLFEGLHSFPPNVRVLSLGKEKKRSRVQYVLRFFSYIWNYRHEYDAVFVHMNQIYILLGGLFWRLWRKRICLWYAHGAVSFSLRLAEKLAHAVTTSTPEGFRIPSKKMRKCGVLSQKVVGNFDQRVSSDHRELRKTLPDIFSSNAKKSIGKVCSSCKEKLPYNLNGTGKVHVVGQGIETERFSGCARDRAGSVIRIVYVGRISPVKRCETLIEAAALLRDRGEQVALTLVGDTRAPGTERYYASLQAAVREQQLENSILFVGGVSHEHILPYLCAADIFVNPSVTGSLDKAGLEGLASSMPLVTCNPAFKHVLGAYADRLMFPEGDAEALAERIIELHRSPDRFEIGETLARVVQKEHSLGALVPRILAILNG